MEKRVTESTIMSVDDYTKLEKIGEGTYGVVYKVTSSFTVFKVTFVPFSLGQTQSDWKDGSFEEDKTRERGGRGSQHGH